MIKVMMEFHIAMDKFVKLLLLIALLHSPWVFAKPYTYSSKNSIQQLFDQAIADKAFPGGCIVVGTAQQIFLNHCYGYYTYARQKPDTPDSLFDLASLTKVIATTSAVMKLYEEGKIDLDDKVVKYLPQFTGPNFLQTKLKATITIRDLLAHSSGLPADAEINNWDDVYRTSLVIFPRRREIYSDLNFLLLGKIVEKVSGMSLDQYSNEVVFKPLSMSNTFFKPGKRYLSETVPTTFDFGTNEYLVARVNDPLSQQLGEVTGNAGLFSTADDLAIFAQMLLNNGEYQGKQIFKPSTINLFTQRANIVFNSSRALGWDMAFVPYSIFSHSSRKHCKLQSCKQSPSQFTAGLYIDDNAYGHTGFTGVSLWISPKYGIFVLLLTNRISPYLCDATQINEMYWRQRINSAVWENLGFTKKNILKEIPKPPSRDTLGECP